MSAWIDGPVLPVFETLANASCGALLLVGLAWISLRLARGVSAAFRAMIWTSVLAAALLLPVVVVFLPATWQVELPGIRPVELARPASPSFVDRTPVSRGAHGPAVPASSLQEENDGPSRLETPRSLVPSVIGMAVAVWAAGALFLLARFATGCLLLHKRCRTTPRALVPEWQSAATAAADQLTVSGEVRLLADADTRMPAVWGFLRATIFLPRLAEWSQERRRVVLLHELAHVRRGDMRKLWLDQLVGAAYWFHPAVRFALTESRMACEQACDDLVLKAGVPPCDYASHLLEVSASLPDRVAAHACVSLLGAQSLERRVASILDKDVSRRAPNGCAKFAASAGLLPLIFLLAAARPLALEPAQVEVAPKPTLKNAGPAQAVDATRPAAQALATPFPSEPVAETAQPPLAREPAPATHAAAASASGQLPSLTTKFEYVPRPADAPAERAVATSEPVAVAGDAAPAPAPRLAHQVKIAEGTPVQLFFGERLSTKTAVPGMIVHLVLVKDLRVDGVVVAKAGASAAGTIVQVKKAKPPGRSGALELRLDYLLAGNRPLKLSGPKDQNAGLIHYHRPFALKWPMGLFRSGDDVEIPYGTALEACISDNIEIPMIDS